MSNVNINDIMKLLSNMDKKDIENGLNQISKILNDPKADKIIKEIKDKKS